MDPLDYWRLAGAGIGAAVALLAVPPTGLRDFAIRLMVSTVCGFIGAPALRHWLEWPEFPRLILVASAACSGASWFVIGAFVRLSKTWGPKG